jgi:hypothetical protein
LVRYNWALEGSVSMGRCSRSISEYREVTHEMRQNWDV